MRRLLSAIKARAATNVASSAMLKVLLISLGVVAVAFIIVWALTQG